MREWANYCTSAESWGGGRYCCKNPTAVISTNGNLRHRSQAVVLISSPDKAA